MLTKTLFQVGLLCTKRLWWEVHEPGAPELVPDPQQQWMFLQGQAVTLAARTRVPEGRFEAPLQAGPLHARVDILESLGGGELALIEVKGSNDIKPEHKWDIAFQRHVADLADAGVVRSELMYLNRDCRHPELEPLFVRKDVSEEILPLVAQVPERAAKFLAVLDGRLPGDSRNENCGDCPFYRRCWPQEPFGVNRFYRMRWSDKLALERGGARTFIGVPPSTKLNSIQQRQRESERAGGMVVSPSLADALAKWRGPLVYLDFETVSFAIPRFPGTTPWTKIPVQYSAHRQEGAEHRHLYFLAEDGGDPRRPLAESLVAACGQEGAVVTYHSSFEKSCLRGLADAVPELAAKLLQIHDRVVDLEPMVVHHVYHPDFAGSFSLKIVLPTLCPDVTYADLTIGDGGSAQFELARLLYESTSPVLPSERAALRTALLAYCERDTWAMVALHRRLVQLAGSPAGIE